MSAVPPALEVAVQDALVGMLMPDPDVTADALQVIVDNGPGAVHAALYAWSAISLKGAGDQPADGNWMIEVTDEKTGKVVSIDHENRIPPEQRDAARLVVLYGNNDHDTIAAITRTYWESGPEALTKLLIATVRLAAEVARQLSGLGEASA